MSMLDRRALIDNPVWIAELYEEQQELSQRLTRLEAFLATAGNPASPHQRTLLYEQLHAYRDLLRILNKRLEDAALRS